ncbi:hypothetical protein ILUMI_11674 [Ignelater luminosus]|uniref:Death domain-containing protein n=1 Tax=Ignelater luminosus TaxID=2038154 RepID=A0A8K0CVR3_IGNLU|nr:hypothetical protein ILUMI_11674 [Ignelater luminosus]
MATKAGSKDPKLETVRDNNVPALPDTYEILEDLITIPKIHPACLYYTEEGYLLLQNICLLLSGTKSTYLYAGWEDFGIKLGLEPIIIKAIKYSLHMEDPASYVFLAYIQKEDATVENILFSLYEIKRHDILLEIKDLARKASDSILRKFNTDNTNKGIIKPVVVPSGPFIFKNFSKSIQGSTNTKLVTESLQRSIPHTCQTKTDSKGRYTKTILLTYSNDADDFVKELLVRLRKPRGNAKLGILVLHEQQHKLSLCPEEFIYECFEQINYVFPIITKQYLEQITSNTNNTTNFSPLENPDHKYVKYIYRLINAHYLGNGCKNTKVRCIIPDGMVTNILKHPITKHSLFQIWIRLNKIDTLIDAILNLKV